MRRKARRRKDAIMRRIVCLRLRDEEFLRLKANALRDGTTVSRMLRDRVRELTQG